MFPNGWLQINLFASKPLQSLDALERGDVIVSLRSNNDRPIRLTKHIGMLKTNLPFNPEERDLQSIHLYHMHIMYQLLA
jgi:hypothetical protein